MNIIINAVHFKADIRLEDFIKERLQKLHTFFEDVIGAEVKLKVDNNDSRENKIVEMRLIIKGNDLFAIKEAKSFEEASDYAVEALRKQLVKYKEKVRRG